MTLRITGIVGPKLATFVFMLETTDGRGTKRILAPRWSKTLSRAAALVCNGGLIRALEMLVARIWVLKGLRCIAVWLLLSLNRVMVLTTTRGISRLWRIGVLIVRIRHIVRFANLIKPQVTAKEKTEREVETLKMTVLVLSLSGFGHRSGPVDLQRAAPLTSFK